MRIRTTVVRAALLATSALTTGCSQEFPAEIAGEYGALEDFSQCVIDGFDRIANIYAGDTFVTGVALPPAESRWGNMAATLTYFGPGANVYELGTTNVRVQYGPLIPHRPDCDGCVIPYRPVYVEGIRFGPVRSCLGDDCLEFDGGGADRYYVWCSSSTEIR